MNAPLTDRLIRQIAARATAASMLGHTGNAFIVAACCSLAVVLSARLLGLVPYRYAIAAVALTPVAALLTAWIRCRRPDRAHAARLVDSGLGTSDLFLTAAFIDGAPGAYVELVVRDAEARALTLKPGAFVRYPARRTALSVFLSVGVLIPSLFLPQLDPFGREQVRAKAEKQRERLRQMQQATTARLAQLQQAPTNAISPKVQQALQQLAKALNETQPNDKSGNVTKIVEQQRALNELWRKQSDEQSKSSARSLSESGQRFGLTDAARTEKWKEELQKGSTASLSKELADLKELAKQFAASTHPAEKESIRQELANRLESLKSAMDQVASSPAVQAAIQQALDQLAMCNQPGMGKQSMQAMAQSLNLTQAEMQQLAQAMRDMQALKDAMSVCQMARRLNGNEPLDGSKTAGCTTMADYMNMYSERLNAMGQGGMLSGQPDPNTPPGPGMGGGPGAGKRPYGSDGIATGFKPENAPSAFRPGTMLMQWKAKGVGETGEAKEAYRQAIQDVRQNASEAITDEQVPPGYHNTIRAYFDSL